MDLKNSILPVLLVDDETAALESEAMLLGVHGLTSVLRCSDSRKVAELLRATPCCVAVLDITMPHIDGITLLEQIRNDMPDMVVVMLTGHHDIATAVACVKKGAFDYIIKPVDEDRLITTVARAIEHYEAAQETQRLRDSFLDGALKRPEVFAPIITVDPRMRTLFRYVEAIAPTRLPVLITGETGAGKELLARAIHDAAGTAGEFVTVNCAGIDDQLFSDTLFGHAKDAYTGASGTRQGLVARARKGTVFLDEIGDLSSESQTKLLRLLQEGTYYALGSDTPLQAETRFVAATNVDLKRKQADGAFRKDLYFRLQAHEVRIPPLRERKDDIQPLLAAFLKQAAIDTGKKTPTAPSQLVTLLRNYDFPGNVRELRGMVYDAVGRHESGVLSTEAFRDAIGRQQPSPELSSASAASSDKVAFPAELPTAEECELALVAEALRRTDGNRSMAADLLGMSRQTFRAKLKRAGLDSPASGGQKSTASGI